MGGVTYYYSSVDTRVGARAQHRCLIEKAASHTRNLRCARALRNLYILGDSLLLIHIRYQTRCCTFWMAFYTVHGVGSNSFFFHPEAAISEGSFQAIFLFTRKFAAIQSTAQWLVRQQSDMYICAQLNLRLLRWCAAL